MKKIIVDKNSNINTIQKAISLIDKNDENEIFIKSGVYHEKVKIVGDNIRLIGEDLKNTVISYDDYAKKIHTDGKEINTFRTYTCMVVGNHLTLTNLVIENRSGDGLIYGQAVALATLGDMIHIENCQLLGHQDTLFLGPLPRDLIIRYEDFLPADELQYPLNHRVVVTKTLIQGDVDFIFGGANAYFEDCTFISLLRDGYVFAPSTEADEAYGFTINRGSFRGLSPSPNTFLARPWRDYGKVVIMNSTYGIHIYDEGFDKWNDSSRDQTCRFSEYNNSYVDHHRYKRCYFSQLLKPEELETYQLNRILREKSLK